MSGVQSAIAILVCVLSTSVCLSGACEETLAAENESAALFLHVAREILDNPPSGSGVDDELRVSGLSAIAAEQAKLGRRDQAEATFREALGVLQASSKKDIHTTASAAIAEDCHEAGFTDMAWVAMEEARRRVSRTNRQMARDMDLDTIVYLFADVGRCEDALAAAKKIRDREFREMALETAAECYGETAPMGEALRLASVKKDTLKRDLARVRVTELYAKQGEVDEAFAWVEKVSRPLERISGFMLIATNCLNQGDEESALVALDEISSIYERHRQQMDKYQESVLLEMTATRYLSAGADEQALRYYRMMKERALDPEAESLWRSLWWCKDIVYGLAALKKTTEALEFAEGVKLASHAEGQRYKLLFPIVKAALENGLEQQAAELTKRLQALDFDAYQRTEAMLALALTYAEAERWDEALGFTGDLWEVQLPRVLVDMAAICRETSCELSPRAEQSLLALTMAPGD